MFSIWTLNSHDLLSYVLDKKKKKTEFNEAKKLIASIKLNSLGPAKHEIESNKIAKECVCKSDQC